MSINRCGVLSDLKQVPGHGVIHAGRETNLRIQDRVRACVPALLKDVQGALSGRQGREVIAVHPLPHLKAAGNTDLEASGRYLETLLGSLRGLTQERWLIAVRVAVRRLGDRMRA